MKTTYHIPTEQYGFIEVEFDNVETLPESYEELAGRFRNGAGQGIDELSFSRLVDKYTSTGSMQAEEYEALNGRQQYAIQTLKKLKKRNDR